MQSKKRCSIVLLDPFFKDQNSNIDIKKTGLKLKVDMNDTVYQGSILFKAFWKRKSRKVMKDGFNRMVNMKIQTETVYKNGLMKLKWVLNRSIKNRTLDGFYQLESYAVNNHNYKKGRNDSKIIFRFGTENFVNQKQSKDISQLHQKSNIIETTSKFQKGAAKSLFNIFQNKLSNAFNELKTKVTINHHRKPIILKTFQKLMNSKLYSTLYTAFITILHTLSIKQQQQYVMKTRVNDNQKKLSDYLIKITKQNQVSQQQYQKLSVQYQSKKIEFDSQLVSLRNKNSQLQKQISKGIQLFNNRPQTFNQTTIYANIYNNLLNYLHNSSDQLNKNQLIKSIITPLSKYNSRSCSQISSQNQCLIQLLKQYSIYLSSKNIKQPQLPSITNTSSIYNNYSYQIHQNLELYKTMDILISKNTKNVSKQNPLIKIVDRLVELEGQCEKVKNQIFFNV